MSKEGKKFNRGRREFLKYSGKTAVRATAYGFLGNLAGRIYRGGRDIYREDIQPYVDKSKNTIGKVENGVKNFIDRSRLSPQEKSETKPKNRKKISRRSFLSLPFKAFHEYPVTTATIVGATYGGAKQSLKDHSKYKTATDIAKLNEKLDYLIELHEGEKEKSKLEKDVEEESDSGKFKISFGIVGVLLSLAMGTLHFTGFSILEKAQLQNDWINIVIFVISLGMILLGVLQRKN